MSNFYCIHHHGELAPVQLIAHFDINGRLTPDTQTYKQSLFREETCPYCKVKKEINQHIDIRKQ